MVAEFAALAERCRAPVPIAVPYARPLCMGTAAARFRACGHCVGGTQQGWDAAGFGGDLRWDRGAQAAGHRWGGGVAIYGAGMRVRTYLNVPTHR